MVIKYAPWTLDNFKNSEHPEYAAIRELVYKNPNNKYILVGTSSKYEYFRWSNVSFFNLPVGGAVKFPLFLFLRFLLPLLFIPSVVIVLGGGLSLAVTGLASFIIRAKLIAVIVGDIRNSASTFPEPFHTLSRNFVKTVFINSYALLAISKSIKKELVISFGVPLKKIFSFSYRISPIFSINVSKDLKESFNPSGPVVLTVARISPEKGLHHLVEASRTIVQKIPNVKFVIQPFLVDLKYMGIISDMLDKYDLKRYFKFFTESVPYSQVPKYMAAADVFVLPSLSEGRPTVILEAMASGLPVVASNVGGIPDVVVDGTNGLLVEPGDVSGLANSILRVLQDVELKQKLSEGAIQTIQKTNEKDFEKLLQYLVVPKMAPV